MLSFVKSILKATASYNGYFSVIVGKRYEPLDRKLFLNAQTCCCLPHGRKKRKLLLPFLLFLLVC